MLTLQIDDEQLQAAIEASLKKLFEPDNYSNPLKGFIEKAVGSSYSTGSLTTQIQEKVVSKINQFMETPGFDMMLGQAVAKAIAEREIAKKSK